jgi:tetratricopeptide (TPR) repeat protein
MSSIYDALKRIQGQKDSRVFLHGDGGASSGNRTRRVLVAAVVVCILCSAVAVTVVIFSGRGDEATPEKAALAGDPEADKGGHASVNLPEDRNKDIPAADRMPGAGERSQDEAALDDVEDYLRQGEHYYAAQEYDKALVTYTQALRFFRRDARLLNNIGIVMLAKGQPEKAVNYFRQSKSLSAHSVEPVYNLACAYARLGDNSQAVSYLKTACTISPEARNWAAGDPDLLILKGVGEFDEIMGTQ